MHKLKFIINIFIHAHIYTHTPCIHSLHRAHLSAHWSGFHDAESSLQSFTISAGIFPGDSSLLPPTLLPPSSSSFIHPLPSLLPLNKTIYTTLVARSNAGLTTLATSDGFLIDEAPPTISNVSIDVEWVGSVVTGTQYTSTAIRVFWDSRNSVSPTYLNFWSVLSRTGIAMPLYPQTAIQSNSVTATNLSLKDGEMYSFFVLSCSAAGVCASSESDPVFVDSSPPVDGFFAVETDSTLGLSWAVPGGMTWRNRPRGDSRILIAVHGFSDAHSDITEYRAVVGSGFGLSDLSSGEVLVTTSLASDNGTRVGLVELERRLELQSIVYITIWVRNGVALESRRVQGSFLVEEVEGRTGNGTLSLLRSSRCLPQSCAGHCTCAARRELCSSVSGECEVVSVGSISPNERVAVFNVAPQQSGGGGGGGVELFSAVTDKLVGRWEVPIPSPFQRLEWTVGERGGIHGAGLHDLINDQIWREAGNSVVAIFSVNPLYPLLDGVTYLFYVRAWFNNTHYAVFGSGGITVDVSGPLVVPGGRVRERGWGAGMVESDYTSNATHIQLVWSGVLKDTPSSPHSRYWIGIGDLPGSDNAVPFTTVDGSLTFDLSMLQLDHGRRYYSTLLVVSPVGVASRVISDGFTVDLSPLRVGVVLDGLQYWDASAQSHTHSASARWVGFHDSESGIHHYELAVTDSPAAPLESEYEDMGIRLRGTMEGLALMPGEIYYAHVVAVNNAGVRSESVSSNGIVISAGRPGYIQCVWEPLPVSSLEPVIAGGSPCPSNTTMEEVAGDWVVEGGSALLLPPSPSLFPLSGCFFLSLSGRLSLSLPTSPSSRYALSFWLAHPPGSGCGHITPLLARVTVPGRDEVVAVHTQTEDGLHRWSRFRITFIAEYSTSSLSLSTLSDQYMIAVDGLTVSRCQAPLEVPVGDTISNISSAFHVSQEHQSGSRTRLHVEWYLGGGGSGVRGYEWAVGAVEGGEQLQQYTSTGEKGR